MITDVKGKMNKKVRFFIYYIIAILVNAGIDYVVKYGTSTANLQHNLINCFGYSIIVTTIIFVLISVIVKPRPKE